MLHAGAGEQCRALARPGSTAPSWLLGAVIGSGSFATVYRAQHAGDGRPAAVKEILLSRLAPKLRESLEGEVAVLRKVVHPNIVRLLDTLQARHRGC